MPKSTPPAPQIKQIKLTPGTLSFGGSNTRRNGKQHQTRELPFRSRKKERNTSQKNGKQGMKRSEIMRQIRNNLLAKKRDALNKSNPSNVPTQSTDSYSDTPSAALSNSAFARTKRKLRKKSGNSPGIFSGSRKNTSPPTPLRKEPANSTQSAIDFFELKKKELILNQSNSTHINNKNSLGSSVLNLESSNHNNPHTISSPKKYNDNHNIPASIHLNIPTSLANASPNFKSISTSPNSYNLNAPKSILKKYDEPSVATTSSSLNINSQNIENFVDPPKARIRVPPDDSYSSYNNSNNHSDAFSPFDKQPKDTQSLNDLDNTLDFNLNNNNPHPDTNTRELRREKKRRHRRNRIERRKTYRLGKNENKDGLSVMVYGNKTRKKLRDEHENFNEGDVSKMRRVLRHRCILKTGSTAPPNLIREMYKNTRLFGDVLAKCNANEATEYLELNN